VATLPLVCSLSVSWSERLLPDGFAGLARDRFLLFFFWHEMDTPVLLPAGLIGIRALRALFTVEIFA
jgi:hypothetical protein